MKRATVIKVFASMAMIGGLLAMTFVRYGSASTSMTVNDVAQGLTCQCGCGLTVANCNHPSCSFSVPVREQIEKMLDSGMSRDQILGAFRAKYGEKILSAPEARGFNVLAWVMPFAVVFLGAAGILIALMRWHADRSHAAPASEESVESYDRRLRYRLKRELERLG